MIPTEADLRQWCEPMLIVKPGMALHDLALIGATVPKHHTQVKNPRHY